MAYSTPYTFTALEVLTAAKMNAIQTNISAMWPYTTAGDLPVAVDGNNITRLAVGAANKILVSNGTTPTWGQAPFQVLHHADATGHTYNSTTIRDMPNSLNTFTLAVDSTVVVVGEVCVTNGTGNQQINCWFQIATYEDSSIRTAHAGANSIVRTVPLVYAHTSIPAGSRGVRIREFQTYSGNTYTVNWLRWVAIAIPE